MQSCCVLFVLSSFIHSAFTRNEIQRGKIFGPNPAFSQKGYQPKRFYCSKCAACDCSSSLSSSKSSYYTESNFLKNHGIYNCYSSSDTSYSDYWVTTIDPRDIEGSEQSSGSSTEYYAFSSDNKDSFDERSSCLVLGEVLISEETSVSIPLAVLNENPTQNETDSDVNSKDFSQTNNSEVSITGEDVTQRENSGNETEIGEFSEKIEVVYDDGKNKEESEFVEKEAGPETKEDAADPEKLENTTVEHAETIHNDEIEILSEEKKEYERQENDMMPEKNGSTPEKEIFIQTSDEKERTGDVQPEHNPKKDLIAPEKDESENFKTLMSLLYGEENDYFFKESDSKTGNNFKKK